MSSWTIPPSTPISQRGTHPRASTTKSQRSIENVPTAVNAGFSPGIKAPAPVSRGIRQGNRARKSQRQQHVKRNTVSGPSVRDTQVKRSQRPVADSRAAGSSNQMEGFMGGYVADQVYDLNLKLSGLRARAARSGDALRSIAQGVPELLEAFRPLLAALGEGVARCNQADMEAVFGRPIPSSSEPNLSAATTLHDRIGDISLRSNGVGGGASARIGSLASEISGLERDVNAAERLGEQAGRLRTIVRWTRRATRLARRPRSLNLPAGPNRRQEAAAGGTAREPHDGAMQDELVKWTMRVFKLCDGTNIKNDVRVVVQALRVTLPAPDLPARGVPSRTEADQTVSKSSRSTIRRWRRPLSWFLGSSNTPKDDNIHADRLDSRSKKAATEQTPLPAGFEEPPGENKPDDTLLPGVVIRVLYSGRPADIARLATIPNPETGSMGPVADMISRQSGKDGDYVMSDVQRQERQSGTRTPVALDGGSARGRVSQGRTDIGRRDGDGEQGSGAGASCSSSLPSEGSNTGCSGAAVELIKSELRAIQALPTTEELEFRSRRDQRSAGSDGAPCHLNASLEVSRPRIQLQIALKLRTSSPVEVAHLVHRGGNLVPVRMMHSRRNFHKFGRTSPRSSSGDFLPAEGAPGGTARGRRRHDAEHYEAVSNRYVTVAASSLRNGAARARDCGWEASDQESQPGGGLDNSRSPCDGDFDHYEKDEFVPKTWGPAPAELMSSGLGEDVMTENTGSKTQLGTEHIVGLNVVLPSMPVPASAKKIPGASDANDRNSSVTRETLVNSFQAAPNVLSTSLGLDSSAGRLSKKRRRSLDADDTLPHEQNSANEYSRQNQNDRDIEGRCEQRSDVRRESRQSVFSSHVHSGDGASTERPSLGNEYTEIVHIDGLDARREVEPRQDNVDGQRRAKRSRSDPSTISAQSDSGQASGWTKNRTWFPWFWGRGRSDQRERAHCKAMSPAMTRSVSPTAERQASTPSPHTSDLDGNWTQGTSSQRRGRQEMDRQDGLYRGRPGSGGSEENVRGDDLSGRPLDVRREGGESVRMVRSPLVVTVIMFPPEAGDDVLG